MSFGLTRALMLALANARPEQRKAIIMRMGPLDLLKFDADFETWAQEGQWPPKSEGWRVWLMMAGRGFGKTRAGAEWIHRLASGRKKLRIALVAASIIEARSIMVEGVSGILSVAGRNQRRVKWEPSLNRLTWRGGSEAHLFSGDSPDGLRGPEHDFAWFLTFEIEADAAPQALGAILADASQQLIQSDSATLIGGYAAHGSSIKSAIDPLVRLGLELFDDGTVLRPATPGAPMVVSEDDLGNSASHERAERIERTQAAARSLPVALTLSYYDPSRDFQTAQMRATIGEGSGREENSELAVVVSAEDARGLVESELARRWARRDQLTLRLPPRCMVIEPGSTIELASTPSRWTVERCVVEAMVAVVDLRPAWTAIDAIVADPGRSLPSPDVVQGGLILALFDLPDLGVDDALPALYLAAGSPVAGWRPVAVEIIAGGGTRGAQTAARKSILGHALTALPSGQPHLLDLINSVEIKLVDENHWLESCDDQALAMGSNLAVVGHELIQFGAAAPIRPGRFRLSRLLRGRRGTEWAMDGHAEGEPFALLEPGTLQRIGLMDSVRGSAIEVRTTRPTDLGTPASISAESEALRPPSPVHLRAVQASSGALEVRWVRRSRHGWAWLDEMGTPLGERREQYRVTVEGAGGRIEAEAGSTAVTFQAAELKAVGPGEAIVAVRQVGDLAASRAAILPIILA
jgi:hypothetical protein